MQRSSRIPRRIDQRGNSNVSLAGAALWGCCASGCCCAWMRLLLYPLLIVRVAFPRYCASWLDDGAGADGDISSHNITRRHEH